MILTDFYRFEKKPGGKSKLRIDSTASTKSYPGFEQLRNKAGELFVYVCENYTERGKRGKSSLALSRTEHITSLNPGEIDGAFWYGDFKGTADALLMVQQDFSMTDGRVAEGAVVEVYVARGLSKCILNLFAEFTDGALNDEMDELRQRATPEPPGSLY
jgi:hypothetical protein